MCVCVCVCEACGRARDFVCNAVKSVKILFLFRKINILISLSIRCYLTVQFAGRKPKN